MYSKKGIIIEVIVIGMIIFCGVISHDVLAMYNDSVSVDSDSEVLLSQDEIKIDNAEETISEILETSKQELVHDVKSSVKLEGDIYYNKDGDLYEFNDDGEVISFTSNTIPGDDVGMVSEDEIVDASEKYLETLVSEPEYYRLTSVEFSYLDADNNIYWDAEVIYEPIYN